MSKGEMRWHEKPRCVICRCEIEDGETVYPITGTQNGVLCERGASLVMASTVGEGLTLRIEGAA